MDSELPSAGYGALAALLIMIGVSVWLGTQAQKAVEKSSFLTGYFLGNRGLGAWTLALTATVQSGGTFMGYPSLIYTHGWIVGLWIASYMVVPLSGFAVLGKRFAQLSRRTGAITVPDLFRARFASPRLGLVASLLIILFMSFLMIAQFKAGAIVMKLAWPHSGSLALSEELVGGVDQGYFLGLAIFSLTVVGYTLIGGFLASVWTDLFQSVLMAIGVAILFVLVVPVLNPSQWHAASETAIATAGPAFAQGPGLSEPGHLFLPPTLAMSYFVVWIFGGIGSPAGMVRVMASKDTPTLRRSIVLLGFYNLLIYLPLLVICVGARAIFPDLPAKQSDEIIPRLAIWATRDLPAGSFIGGLILAAPFGAVMSTVSSYLVVISSGLVRDVYQHFINPHATETQVRRASHLAMITLGLIAVGANIHPVRYLQALVVFSTAAGAATFVVPAVMLAYWRRATAVGTGAAMLAGAATILGLFAYGLAYPQLGIQIDLNTSFRSYYPWGFHPVIFGVLASLLAGIGVSLATAPPPEEVVSRLFDEQPAAPPSPGIAGV